MFHYTAGQVARIVEGELFGDSEVEIGSVSIDSRTPGQGTDVMFVAIPGSNHDGHTYVEELYTFQKVRVFLVSRISGISDKCPDATFIRVPDTLEALQQLASWHRRRFGFPVIGITGSNGKTIVKEWLNQLLSPEYRIVRSPKSYNSQVGVPLSVLQMSDEFQLGIFEAGISQPGEMLNLQAVILPTIGILTNIGLPHQENFDDLDEKITEKLKLFKSAEVLIYCKDHRFVDRIIADDVTLHSIRLITWGSDSASTVRIVDKHEIDGRLLVEVAYGEEQLRVEIPFTDQASFENAMHCLTLLLYFNIDRDDIAARISRLTPIAMRLEQKEGINGCVLINDSYNSDLGSLAIALDFLAQQKPFETRMLILSDIHQSGFSPELLYSKVAQLIEEKGINYLIGIGPQLTRFSHFFDLPKEFYADTEAFIRAFKRDRFGNAAILVKGSRDFQFERISALLEYKTHRTILEVNLNALIHNLNLYRSKLNRDVKVMAMVKAFSYGSGSFEIANVLQFHRVDYLGVAYTDEGVALREAGISLPIVVLNPSFGTYELMVEYRLEPEIFNFSGLSAFVDVLDRLGESAYPIHLKLDTGMHRLGFSSDQLNVLAGKLQVSRAVRVASIFSHLAASDEPRNDSFTREQLVRFREMSGSLVERIGYKPLLHILNTAGIERFPEAQLDMVRMGIGLYGISPSGLDGLQVVSSLKSTVIQLKELNSGETVGYSRRGVVKRPSRIAVIPVGYADGLNRRLGNGVGRFKLNGKLVPTIGNINMDTCMLDVTDVAVREGDEVVLFGENPSIEVLARAMDTIPYEVFTSISRRVRRIYYRE